MSYPGDIVRLRTWKDFPRKNEGVRYVVSEVSWKAKPKMVGLFLFLGSEPEASIKYDDIQARLNSLGFFTLEDICPHVTEEQIKIFKEKIA